MHDGEGQDRPPTEMPTAAFLAMPDGAPARFAAKYGYLGIVFVPLHAGYRPGWTVYDVMHRGVNKGLGLQGLCRAIGVPPEQVAAAGDGANDLELLQAAGLGCAMGNAVRGGPGPGRCAGRGPGPAAGGAVAARVIPGSFHS